MSNSCVGAAGIVVLYGGVVLIVVAFAMPNWREYEVNISHAANMSFDFKDRQHFNFSRTRGFFKICFRTTEELPTSVRVADNAGKHTHLYASTAKCAAVDWDHSLLNEGPEKMQLRLQLASVVLYGMALFACAAYLPLSWFTMSKPRIIAAIASLLSLVVAVVFISVSVVLFERSLSTEEDKLWPKSVKLFTIISNGHAYIVAWAGVALLCVSVVVMGSFAWKSTRVTETTEVSRDESDMSMSDFNERSPSCADGTTAPAPPSLYVVHVHPTDAEIQQPVPTFLSSGGLRHL